LTRWEEGIASKSTPKAAAIRTDKHQKDCEANAMKEKLERESTLVLPSDSGLAGVRFLSVEQWGEEIPAIRETVPRGGNVSSASTIRVAAITRFITSRGSTQIVGLSLDFGYR
jgi:hypothetical protein